MTDDLVERLLLWEEVFPEDLDKEEGHLYYEAADRIEALMAELANTRHELGKMFVKALEFDERAEAAEADNARLKAKCEALGQEVNMAKYGQPDFAWSIHSAVLADLQADNARLRAGSDLWEQRYVSACMSSITLECALGQQEADNARLRSALLEERTETLWNAYNTGMDRDGRWRHMCMSDGEWLERECGLDTSQPDHPSDVVKAVIPLAAKRFVATLTGKEPSHE